MYEVEVIMNKQEFLKVLKESLSMSLEKDAINEMIKQSEIMAKDTYYLRVDFYDINGKLVFGEATFFTWSGFMKFNPPEYDRILGDKIKLPIDE